MSTRSWTLGLTLGATLLTVGCARNLAPDGAQLATTPVRGAATLVVQNYNFADVDVFAVQDGDVSTRLGMVTGESTANFAVDPSLFPAGMLALVARPIGGFGVACSGPVVVSPGQTVTFMIQPDLRASMGST
jgi:hypothetical protein